MRVIALDLSTSATAIAHTHDHHGRPALAVRTIHTALRPLHEQIDTVWRDVVAAVRCRPDLVVIEGTFSRPGASDYPLHALHGVVKQWLWSRGVPYVDVAPATLKVWATGSGATRGVNKVTKDRVIEGVLSAYGGLLTIDPRDDNQCDAVALLTLGLAAYGCPLVRVTDRRAQAVKVPSWPTLDASPEVAAALGNRP